MTAGPEMPPDNTPLTPEELALAQRLVQLGSHGEPSPALDARILAAAHAAVGGSSTRSQRQGKRWPLLFGVAASLALAVGIAWRLRPLPDAAPAYESEAASATVNPLPAAAPAADTDAAGMIGVEAGASDRAGNTPSAPEPATAREQPASTPLLPEPEAFPQQSRTAPAPPPPEESPIVFDQPSPIAAQAPQPAAPAPPPPTSPAVENAQAGAAAAAPPAATSSDARTQRARQPRARDASKPVASEYGIEEDIPPATADAPEVRDVWLQRIRELAAVGRLDDARASLHEFIRRYPDYPLPDDLRALDP